MPLHVNIGKLIKGQVVETGRIEYKSGWNPESVIHSMYAFANDINNLGGGYIVIGVEVKDGIDTQSFHHSFNLFGCMVDSK